MHGRERELERLGSLLAGARDGLGGTAVVSGGIGSGRTTVLGAVAARAGSTGMQVLRACAAPAEREFARGVVHQLVDPLLPGGRVHDDLPVGVEDDLPVGVEGDLPVGAEDATLADPVEFLDRTTAPGSPLVVLVDDLQWADDPSLDWLVELALSSHERPVALVCSVLAGDRGADRRSVRRLLATARDVRLHPLSERATTAVVEEWIGAGSAPGTAGVFHAASLGNPMVLTQLLSEAAASGDDTAARTPVGALRPPALLERFARAVRDLDDEALRYLRSVVVLDEDGDAGTIRRLSGLDAAAARTARARLVDAGLLLDRDPPGPSHPAVADVALGPTDRCTVHAEAARLLHEVGRPPAEVAGHLLACTTPLERWAVHTLRTAASLCLAEDPVGGGRTAADHLRRVLLDGDLSPAERGSVLADLAAAESGYAPTIATRHVAQALPLLDGPRARARAIAALPVGAVVTAPAEVRDAVRQADADPATAGDRPLALRIRTRRHRLDEQTPEGLEAGCDRLQEVLADPDAELSTSAGQELITVLLHGAALSGRVPAASVAGLGARLLRIVPAHELDPTGALPELLGLALVAADRAGSLAHRLAVQQGAAAGAGRSADLHALLALTRGREVRLAPRDPDAPVTPLAVALTATAVVKEARIRGTDTDTDLARPRLPERAMHRLRRSGAASAAGDLPLALECLLDAGRHLDHLGWCNPAVFPWRGRAALLAARLGEVGTARDLAETELSLATSWGAPAALGRALRVRAELAEGPERLRLLRSASAVLADSEDGAEADRVTVALEHCPDAVPRPGATGGGSVPPRPVPRPVLAPHPAAGAPPASAEAPLGAAVAARAGSSRSTRTGAGRLTAGEQEAVALVQAGASNQQIAQQLRVSRRAVEKRLTSAYRKLGIGGRGDLGPG